MAKRRWLSLDAGASNWLWLTVIILVLDQYTKWLIVTNLELFDSLEVLPVFNIVRYHNEGAAFSFLSNASGWQRWFFTALGIGVSCLVLVWLRRLPPRGQNLLAAGLACIVGGALGNVIDRVVHGHVIDFIELHYRDAAFPAFNMADSAITVGAALLILENLLDLGRRKAEAEKSADRKSSTSDS